MKLKTFYSLVILLSTNLYLHSQVGINTTNPQATLDIVAEDTTTAKDGVMPPRLTKQQLASKVAGTYGVAQTGIMIYISDVTTPTGITPSLGQTTGIENIGYYFFNGSIWKNVAGNSVNIYNADGSLTGSRVVNQASNPLSFNGNTVNSFSINGDTFSIDAANNRVGIGTITPTNKLHLNSINPLRAEGIQTGNPSTDRTLVVDESGVIKSINSLNEIGVPTPAIFRLQTAQRNFLNRYPIGSSSRVPMTLLKNSIKNLTYNSATRTITIPPGIYQMTFTYEGTHNKKDCTVSSYFVDFPSERNGSTRIHSTSSHIVGDPSNHGGTITYATQILQTTNWVIQLGRGQSGNCLDEGMILSTGTQLLIYRIGDI